MRICLVTLDFAPFRSSGLAVYGEKLAQGLVARGHRVTVVAADRPQEESLEAFPLLDGIQVVRVPIGPTNWIGVSWRAASFLHKHQAEFDVIHFLDVHFAYAYRGRFLASAFQSFRQRLDSHHGLPYHTNRRNLLFRWFYYQAARWTMERRAVTRACHIIMPSRSTQQEFVAEYGLPSGRTSLVYLGIDLQRFNALQTRSDARQKLGLGTGDQVLLYVGFSTARKGVVYLAEALRLARSPARLLMVGKWEPGYLQRFLERLGDAQQRAHVVGYVPDAELGAYYAAADVFVSPTLLEGFGIPLVEAMATGLPVITTTGGAAAEVVGEGGITVSPADSQALASAIERVLGDPELRQQLGRNGQRRAHTLFDQSCMIDNTESVYRSVLKAEA